MGEGTCGLCDAGRDCVNLVWQRPNPLENLGTALPGLGNLLPVLHTFLHVSQEAFVIPAFRSTAMGVVTSQARCSS
jgi:hypothetical protein